MSHFRRSIAFFISAAVVAVYAVVGTHEAPAPASAATMAPVIVIVMENKERSTITGSSEADYLNAFRAAARDFTHYYGVTHPSLPNYLATASGSTQGKSGSDSISAGEIGGANLFGQLSGASVSWNVFMESMPSACYGGGSSGDYVLRHNPAIPFANIWTKPARCDNVVPYSAFDVSALPQFSFIVPNLCNDMHDCSIATGDNWLAARVPAMLSAGAKVIITFDEGSSSTNGGGNIYTAIRGPGITSAVNNTTFNHYSLLAALEARYGVIKLNNAVTATQLPI